MLKYKNQRGEKQKHWGQTILNINRGTILYTKKPQEVVFSKRKLTSPVSVDTFTNSTNTLRKQNMFTLSFTGLTKALSGKLYELTTDINKKVKRSGIVGNLPEKWINTIPKASRGNEIRDIYAGFALAGKALMLDSDTAIKYYYDYKDDPESLKPLLQDNLDQASNHLKDTLVKHKIISPEEELKIEYLGIGLHGCGYKFEIAGKKYVIKSYHSYNKEEMSRNNYHGPGIESNRAIYINKHFKHSQYAKFYFSDLKSNYMVLQFINKETDKPKAIFQEQDHGFQYNDLGDKEKYNLINNYLIDYGSISIKSKILTNNKTAQWVHKKVVNKKTGIGNYKEWDKLYNTALQNKIPNCNDILLGLVDAVRFLPKEHREKRALKFITSNKFDNNFKANIIDYIIPDDALFPIHVKANFKLTKKQHFSAIDQLLQHSNKDIKHKLADKIKTIEDCDKFKLFSKLSSIKDTDLTNYLKELIPHLPNDKQQKATVLLLLKTA